MKKREKERMKMEVGWRGGLNGVEKRKVSEGEENLLRIFCRNFVFRQKIEIYDIKWGSGYNNN